MKKGRPGTLVTVITDPARREPLLAILFEETTTLGIRVHEATREILARELVPVETQYGSVRMKIARRNGAVVNASPEFDDCVRLATEQRVAVKHVLAAATHAWLSGAGRSR
jgi:uncharacterized protein (DUF111 family)